MKHNIQPLTDLELKQTNGGEGIIAYDPATGAPFPEENGGYPPFETAESALTPPQTPER